MKVEYGDYWKSHYEKKKNTLPSYAEFVEIRPSAELAVESINEYRFGKCYSVLKPLLTSTSLLSKLNSIVMSRYVLSYCMHIYL